MTTTIVYNPFTGNFDYINATSSSTLAQISLVSTDTTKSIYTMTTGVPINFKLHGGSSLLYLDEANGRIGSGTSSPAVPFDVKTPITNTTETPLQSTANGSDTSNPTNSDFNLGFRFTPIVDGTVTKLWIRGGTGDNLSHLVSLYDSNGNSIASASITSVANTWVSANITPVSLSNRVSYIISERVGSGKYYYSGMSQPFSQGNIIINEGRYISASNAVPNTVSAGSVFENADITFVPNANGATISGSNIILGNTGYTNVLVLCGDSITFNQGASPAYSLTETFVLFNTGVSGDTIDQMQSESFSTVDPKYAYNARRNIAVVWGGTNNFYNGQTLEQTKDRLIAYCQSRKKAGFKVVVVTMLSRTGNGTLGNAGTTMDTFKNQYNAYIRAHWQEFADSFADVAANANLGADGAYSNATYFPDGIHPSAAGYALAYPVISTAINNITDGVLHIPTVVGNDRKTGLTAAQALATFTVGQLDTSYHVSANVLVTTSTLHSFTITCTYTDDGNTSRIVTLPFQLLAGTSVTSITNAQGAVPYEGTLLHIRAKAGTTIVIEAPTGGTYTTVTYNLEERIVQI